MYILIIFAEKIYIKKGKAKLLSNSIYEEVRMVNLREFQEKQEFETLSFFATKAAESKGRQREEEKCSGRTDFQRDCDRIIHSKAFRRLMHKTQVFLAPAEDHYRTRLTHTLEVSAVARSITRGLRLNENLAEAISLGHDLGHTPFGHAGEAALDEISECGFSHNEQSLRVVDILENKQGLNLTYEVRDGILNHTGNAVAATPEGKIIKYADRIAYINHDIDDAVRAGVLKSDELPFEFVSVLGMNKRDRINNSVQNIIDNSKETGEITMSPDFYSALMGMRSFLFEKVYNSRSLEEETRKAKNIIFSLYEHFMKNKDDMPDEYIHMLSENPADRVVCDYIAGMTDRYAINLFNSLFVPRH